MTRPVPYYSQWESRHLVADFISGAQSSLDDPRWADSGASSIEEYALWARHMCGMACVKMLLCARTGVAHPTIRLLERALRYGAYVMEDGGIRGMIYAPATQMLRQEFGVESEVITHIQANDIEQLLGPGEFFIASVHPIIRWLDREPPLKGGHLVLVTRASDGTLTFHNPSGDTPESQENVVMQARDFDRYFAGRGILVR